VHHVEEGDEKRSAPRVELKTSKNATHMSKTESRTNANVLRLSNVLKPKTTAMGLKFKKVTRNLALQKRNYLQILQERSSHVKDRVEEGRKLLEVVQRAEARHDGDGDEVEEDDEERDAVHRGLPHELLPPVDAQVLPDDVTGLRGELGLPRLGLAGVRRLRRRV
jgi:hypothetical protein